MKQLMQGKTATRLELPVTDIVPSSTSPTSFSNRAFAQFAGHMFKHLQISALGGGILNLERAVNFLPESTEEERSLQL